MENDIKVSVIVPIYGVEKYLKRAVDSLVSQTLEGIEIILVDDGSADGCGRIIDEYAERCPCCSALHKKNGGLSDARNVGIAAARGQYIGFVDPDDYVENNMFDDLFRLIQKKSADLAICGLVEEYSKSYIVKQKNECISNANDKLTLIQKFFYGAIGAYACNKLFKRSIILEHKIQFPAGIQVVEDQVFFSRYLIYVNTFISTEKCLYHYIRNDSSICAKYHNEQAEYYKVSYEERNKLIESLSDDIIRNKLSILNSVDYIKNMLSIFDRIHARGIALPLKAKYFTIVSICDNEDFRKIVENIEPNYFNKDIQIKIKLLRERKYLLIELIEIWRISVCKRLEYYFKCNYSEPFYDSLGSIT